MVKVSVEEQHVSIWKVHTFDVEKIWIPPQKSERLLDFFFVIEKEKKEPVLFPFQIVNLKTSTKKFQILSLTNFH